MPSFWTHYAFAEECRSALPSGELSDAIERHPHAYHAGMQGPDLFLFYLPAVLRKKRLSTELHTHSPAQLLACLWRQSANTKGKARPIALAYAVGFLGHYCLDSEVHPFVYAFAGRERTAKSYCKHNALEADLNALTVERALGKSLQTLDIPDVYDLSKDERAVISKMLSRAIRCVYRFKCTPETVCHALTTVRLACRLLSDRSGKKATCFRAIEKALGLPYLSPLFLGVSHYCTDPAGLTHKPWRDPYTGEVSETDVFALYDSAKTKYITALCNLHRLRASEFSAFFNTLCVRDFHGEPNQK